MSAGKPDAELRAEIEAGWHTSKMAQQYARAENVTGQFADVMVKKSGLANYTGEPYVFDLACGTGAVEAAIYKAVPKEKWGGLRILGGDISEPMLQFLRERKEREGWTGLELRTVNGADMQLPADTYTHLFICFGIFFMPPTVLPSCFTITAPGGFIAINAWNYFPWSRFAARALARVPGAPEYPPESEIESKINGGRPWNKPEFVEQTLKETGFVDVEAWVEERNVDVGTPEEFLEVMGMPLGLVASFWPEEGREVWLEKMKNEMIVLGREEAGGEGKHLQMVFKAVIGTGRKPS